jgi:beta-N-acetylhexosaminidase
MSTTPATPTNQSTQLAIAASTPAPTPSPTVGPTVAPPLPQATGEPATGAPSLAQLVGQKLVIPVFGPNPGAGLLDRIRRGRIGGVILFGSDVTTPAALRTLTATLQGAAAEGGQPPLLIATDQEGGSVKRIPWAPPTLSAPELGAIGLKGTARDQGMATGAALLDLGVNCDFAPVADVPRSTASFMYLQGRTWSFDASATAALSEAFARGLWSAGVLPAMKHFPGVGRSKRNTDLNVVTLNTSKAGLAAELAPYRLAVEHGLPMIMLSNVTYTAYDPANAAGWSRAIVKGLLRDELGFQGVTITDSLSGISAARGVPASKLALRAATAGTDMILISSSRAITDAAYDLLLAEARSGSIPRARLQNSYDRILTLKAGL